MFTARKVAFARGLEAWMARARSSLPTPVSPVISTGMSLEACISASRSSSCMGALHVWISAKASWFRSGELGGSNLRWYDRTSLPCSSASSIVRTSLAGATGLIK